MLSIDVNMISDIIRELGEGHLKDYPMDENTTFESLGFDSMTYVELLVKLEEITKKDLEQILRKVDFTSIETIGSLVKVLENID